MGSCSSKRRIVQQKIQFGNSPSEEWPNRNFYPVTLTEVATLKLLFKDLAARNQSETHLYKLTFLIFFQLPVRLIQGILGEKLFSEFDKNRRGVVTCNDFITQIELFCRGEHQAVIKKIFDLCKFSQDECLRLK